MATQSLERSSLETYFGYFLAVVLAVLTGTWKIRAVLFIFSVVLGGFAAWYSPWGVRWGRTKKTRRVWLAIVVSFLIGVGGAWNVWQQYQAEMIPPEPLNYILAWGVAPLTHPDLSLKESQVEVDGKTLAKWENTHRLMVVAFMWAGKDDSYSHPVAKSELVDIHDGPIDITIPWNDELEALHEAGKGGTLYYVVLLPDGIAASRINSLNDVKDNGGYVVDKAMGPP